jgi:hypothetical protein
LDAHRDFRANRRSPALVRSFVGDVLDDWGIEVGPPRDIVLLLASELATNAVDHATGDFSVDVHMGGGSDVDVRVEVFDGDPHLPTLQDPDPRAERGRGLLLVDGLASAWGSEPRHDGKVVWFETPCRPGPSARS